jgi:hypothetical protein
MEIIFPALGQESGTDVMILKIFAQKNFAKKWRFLLKTKLKLNNNIGIEEKRQFFRRKLGKKRRNL